MKRRYNKVRKYEEGGGTSINPTSMITRGISTLGNLYNTVFNLDDELDKKDDSIENDIQSLATTQFSGGNDTLAKMSTMLPAWKNIDAEDLGGETDLTKTGISSFISGYTSGLSSGIGPLWSLAPAVADTVVNLISGNIRNNKINSRVNQLNTLGKQAESQVRDNFNYAVANTDTKNDRFRIQNMLNTNYAAFGGLLETNGSNWDTGATYIDNGSTHQNNPLGGVQYGVAADGVPNLVEEGEVVIKVRSNPNQGHSFAEGGSPAYEDYVLSAREYPLLEEIINANITNNPDKYEGMSWAEIYKAILDKNNTKEIINRKDTKDYLASLNERVAQAQETTKLREQQEMIMDRFKNATPEEQNLILQQAGYPNLLEEAAYAAHGGKIYIKPSKRGTFTAAAKKRGMGVQEFASKVLANPENYTEAMRKKAQFAHNAKSFKHANGGYLFPWGGWKNQDELNKFYQDEFNKTAALRQWDGRTHNYFRGSGARQWIKQLESGDEQQRALAVMLKNQWGNTDIDWSDEATWEFKNKYNPRGTITESSPYLQWAGNNTAMKDALWGIKHVPQLSVDNRYLYREPVVEKELPSPNVGSVALMTDITPEGIPVNLNSAGENYILANPSQDIINPFADTKDYRMSKVDTDVYPVPTIEYDKISAPEDIGNEPSDNEFSGYNNDWVLPTISGANLLADIMGITNTADYSNANRIGRAILPPRYIGYDPNGRYVRPLLTDKNYISTRLGNQNIAAINAAKDLAGGNSAAALNNIALNNYINNMAIGQSMAQTDEANNETIRQAVAANNTVDRANAEGVFNADRANQSAWENYVNRYATQKTKEAMLREEIDTQVAANRSANWNNFLENMQGYFDNQRNREMANLQYAWSGYQYKGKDGKIHLQYNTPEEKRKAERLVKKQPKDKQKNYIVEPVKYK